MQPQLIDVQQAAGLLRLGARSVQYEHGKMRFWLPANLLVELIGPDWFVSVIPYRNCND